ncbi:MAG: site-specific DNA-methyltransferase [Candidatus Omnitrophota bacterium]
MLIHGDNLLALKALEQDFSGKIKCIYIDPPYNTGSAFAHYDDNLEHSTWLNLMRPRLEILKNLLNEEQGSIWISIDDDECHYLKVLCDEVFGRSNFVANVIWEKKYSPQNDAKWLSDSHDHILVYARNKNAWRPNLLPRTEEMNERYKNPDNDSRGPWKPSDMLRKDVQKSGLYSVKTPAGRVCNPPAGRSWRIPEYRYHELLKDNRLWFGKDGQGVPAIKRFLSDVQDGMVCKTIWNYSEVGTTDESAKEVKTFNPSDPFATPKPERLIFRILSLASNVNDSVLDSFLGSGTTAAVAHKMGRKWIGIEFGEHANTHCLPRLKKVVDGKDGLALSEVLNWKGGGGFRFYNLAPSLLRKDRYGNWVIDEKYNANMLAAAMCKHEGFKFFPDEEIYWKQGKSTESDYIFVTTSFVTVEQLDKIHEEMSIGVGNRQACSLLICAKSFAPQCKERHSNITIKKIPQMVLGKCEFGKDNYDLNIINAPKDGGENGDMEE